MTKGHTLLASDEPAVVNGTPRSVTSALAGFWREGTRTERAGYAVGVLLLLSGLVHAVILLTSGGAWEGPLSLRKPTTFGLSFGLTLVTIVWVSTFIPISRRMRTGLIGVFTLACVLETSLVTLQAWRGVPSHFNVETAFDAFVTRGLAAGGLTLIVVIAILTWASFRTEQRVPMSLRIAVRVGFVALLGAQVVGAVMIAHGMTMGFAGQAKAAYATAGALKPIHAVTMHGILVLPALAWLLSFADWNEERRTRAVWIAAGLYVLTVGVAVTSAT